LIWLNAANPALGNMRHDSPALDELIGDATGPSIAA
jgi:hypothetical protein